MAEFSGFRLSSKCQIRSNSSWEAFELSEEKLNNVNPCLSYSSDEVGWEVSERHSWDGAEGRDNHRAPRVLGPGSKMAGTLDQELVGAPRPHGDHCAVQSRLEIQGTQASHCHSCSSLCDLFPCLLRSPAVATQHSPSLWMFFQSPEPSPPSSLPTCQLLTPTPPWQCIPIPVQLRDQLCRFCLFSSFKSSLWTGRPLCVFMELEEGWWSQLPEVPAHLF